MLGKTKTKILRLIAKSPKHGYALSKELGVSISSIYDHLKELEKSGLVAAENKGDKVNYRITENGKLLLKALKVNMSEKTDT